jgi:hypothetical protein
MSQMGPNPDIAGSGPLLDKELGQIAVNAM